MTLAGRRGREAANRVATLVGFARRIPARASQPSPHQPAGTHQISDIPRVAVLDDVNSGVVRVAPGWIGKQLSRLPQAKHGAPNVRAAGRGRNILRQSATRCGRDSRRASEDRERPSPRSSKHRARWSQEGTREGKRLRNIILCEGSAAFAVVPSSIEMAVALIRIAEFSPT